MANIKKLIKKYRQCLQWRVIEESQESANSMEIISDPIEQTHTVLFPDSGKIRPIEHLHELGHAHLAESVHPLLSTSWFSTATKPNEAEVVRMVNHVSSDWFVDQWLMGICPAEVQNGVSEHYRAAREILNGKDEAPDWMALSAGFLAAQATIYLRANASAQGLSGEAMQEILKIDPKKPSIKAMEQLNNALLPLVSPYRCALDEEDDLSVWRVEKVA
jgi:hypothetical protein